MDIASCLEEVSVIDVFDQVPRCPQSVLLDDSHLGMEADDILVLEIVHFLVDHRDDPPSV
jgi:hypothetical protein